MVLGFEIDDSIELARRARVLLMRHDPSGIDIDISLGALPFEHEMVERHRSMSIGRITIPVTVPEDLIIMKALARRARDIISMEPGWRSHGVATALQPLMTSWQPAGELYYSCKSGTEATMRIPFRNFTIFCYLALAISLVYASDQRPDPKVPQGENLDMPQGWIVRTDHRDHPTVVSSDKDKADIWFVNMTPGWHITTKPAAIFYHPASTASGNYRATTKIHLFDPQGRNEAFGMFFGGDDLDQDSLSYAYFLIRNSGEFLIKRRTGEKTSLIQDWKQSESIRRWNEGDTSVANRLSIECTSDTVSFSINGDVVATRPRTEIRTDGIVGLRINHRTNVHIEDLSVEPID